MKSCEAMGSCPESQKADPRYWFLDPVTMEYSFVTRRQALAIKYRKAGRYKPSSV